MNLSLALSRMSISYVLDRYTDFRGDSSDPVTSVEIIDVSTATEALDIGLSRSETPLAVITANGRFYIFRSGIHGVILIQGPEVTESQRANLERLAEVLYYDHGQTLEGFFTVPVKKAKNSKNVEGTVAMPDPVLDASVPLDADTSEPTE